MTLADAVYETAETWPALERFRLSDQVLRAAISIPSNIAEGHGRESPGDFARHLSIAYGSLCELENQLYMAEVRGYLDRPRLDRLIIQTTEVGRIVRGLRKSALSRIGQALREEETRYDETHVDASTMG